MLLTPMHRRLAKADKILFIGAGGGFDVYSSIPLALSCLNAGKKIAFGNFSFTDLTSIETIKVGPSGHLITLETPERHYFPELHLKRWLMQRGINAPVYAFQRTGVQPLVESYRAVFEIEVPDAVVLIDGGTDSLIKGDEASLGTITEDAVSLVALNTITGSSKSVPTRSLVCLGFGIDLFHGICHHSFLEHTAEAIRNGGFLGCISVVAGTPEGDALIELAAHVNAAQPKLKSIVVNSIADATSGHFGDHHSGDRTIGSTLFINALMSLYWCYDADQVVEMMQFADAIRLTASLPQAELIIERLHAKIKKRDWLSLPL